MAILYPDCSNHQWRSPRELTNFLSDLSSQGFPGICHKVSEGDGYSDPYWQACKEWCQQNNMPCLGYHYVTTDNPGSQAQQWLHNNGGPNVMLDFEVNSGDINNFWNVVNAFNAVGVNVQLAYLPRWYWQGHIGSPDLSSLTSNGILLVSSSYPVADSGLASTIYDDAGGDTGPGWAPYGGATPSAWQFTDRATIGGINVDCNAYLGFDINVLFGSAQTPGPPPGAVPTYRGLPVDDSIYSAIPALAAQFNGGV